MWVCICILSGRRYQLSRNVPMRGGKGCASRRSHPQTKRHSSTFPCIRQGADAVVVLRSGQIFVIVRWGR